MLELYTGRTTKSNWEMNAVDTRQKWKIKCIPQEWHKTFLGIEHTSKRQKCKSFTFKICRKWNKLNSMLSIPRNILKCLQWKFELICSRGLEHHFLNRRTCEKFTTIVCKHYSSTRPAWHKKPKESNCGMHTLELSLVPLPTNATLKAENNLMQSWNIFNNRTLIFLFRRSRLYFGIELGDICNIRNKLQPRISFDRC